jgi:uncharacterized protein YigE (DUF2233 family)
MPLTIKSLRFLFFTAGLIIILAFAGPAGQNENKKVMSHVVDPSDQKIIFFSEKANGEKIKSFKTLQTMLSQKGQQLAFAMNGGIYMRDYTPLGLYIEKGIVRHKLNNRNNGYGNFYLQPNGIFYLTNDHKARIVTTGQFINKNIRYATQSGPMLVINGKINPKFKKGSANLHIRNGVGILPDGKILFAISKVQISFYDFAEFFKSQGCRNALYMDGVISRMYLPSKNLNDLQGDFGIIIAEIS